MAKLQIKKSNETGKVPQPSDLDWGELALNYTDGKLFYKKHGTNTVELLTSVTRLRGTTSGTYTSGDLTLVAGTNITVTQSGSEYTIASAGGADSTKLPLAGGTLTGDLNIQGTTATSVLKLYVYGSTQWSLGVGDTSGSNFGISADFGTFSINKLNGNVTTPGQFYAGTTNLVLHTGNYNSYALPLTGGTLTGALSVALDASIYGITVGRGAGAVATNTAVGASALAANTTGSNNTAIGYEAALSTTTGTDNASFGLYALRSNTTGASNVAVGRSALQSNTTASTNTAVGYQAGYSNTTGYENDSFGTQAGYSYTTTNRNTSIGTYAGRYQTGYYNVFVGAEAGQGNNGVSNASTNVGIGTQALTSVTTGNNNVAVGGWTGGTPAALASNTSGGQNIAIGSGALGNNTTASNNTAVGYQAGYSNTTGTENVFIGKSAGYSGTTGSYSVVVGTSAGASVTTGQQNTLIGYAAGGSITTGSFNTIVGPSTPTSATGYLITTGSKNTILGGYNGNQGGLDIRTANNYIVLSDGDGNPRIVVDGSGNTSLANLTAGAISASNITITGELRGPATMYIDPAAVGDNTGTLVIRGNLQVDGTTTTINSTTVAIDDLNIQLAADAPNAAAANGAGISVAGAGATFTYTSANDSWNLNKKTKIGSESNNNGNALTIANGPYNQVNITHATSNSWGLMLGFGDGSIVGNYHGTNHAAIINVQDAPLHLGTNNDAKFSILGNGNTGIGIISPSYKLDVYNNASDAGSQIRIKNAYQSASADAIMNIDGYGASVLKLWRNGIEEWKLERIVGTDNLQLSAYGGAVSGGAGVGTVQFWDYDTGNVGIGTAEPGLKLHVRGDEGQPATSGSTQNGLVRVHAGSTEGYGETLDFGVHVGASGPASYAWLQSTNWTNLAINYNLALNPNGGNVGIGTTAPGTILDVNGNVRSRNGGFILSTGTTQQGGLFMYNRISGSGTDYSSTIFAEAGLGIYFAVNGSANRAMVLNSSGNLGIGTTSPESIFHISTTSSSLLRLTRSSNVVGIELAGGASGGWGLFDYARSAYDIWMINGNVGIGTTSPSWLLTAYAPSVPQFALQNATRSFILTNNSGDNLLSFNYGGVNRLQFDTTNQWINSGNLGIGFSPGTNPSYKLHVTGDIYANGGWLRVSGNQGLYFETWAGGWYMQDSTWIRTYNEKSVYTGSGVLATNSGGVSSGYGGASPPSGGAIISGNTGIGTQTPQYKLDVYQSGIAASFGATIGSGQIAGIHFGYSEATNTAYRKSALVFERTDNHNQGGNASGKIHFLLMNSSNTSATSLAHSVVTIDSDANGAVGSVRMGVGTTTPTYTLQVNGSFAATTKSFVIDHPTKPGKKLRYGSLEGPENGVYVRGRLRGTKIELPDYWTGLVDPDSITVQLTPHGRRQDVWVTKIADNCVYVQGTTQPDCYYFIQAERVDVAKLEVEID